MSILSIDYGKKRIGIAVSDPELKFAFPVGTIDNNGLKYVLSELKKIVQNREIKLIIIGMPYNMSLPSMKDPSDNPMVKEVSSFVNVLKQFLNLPVETVDERLSSFSAEDKLRESGLNPKEIKKYVDQEAARILLEEYLNKEK